jgi:hypothetical protein
MDSAQGEQQRDGTWHRVSVEKASRPLLGVINGRDEFEFTYRVKLPQITAPAPGRVAFVGRKFGFGLVVEIDHGNGVLTRYAHCGSALVAAGAWAMACRSPQSARNLLPRYRAPPALQCS